MALYHWERTAYQDVANVFDADDLEDEIEEAAHEFATSKEPTKDLPKIAAKVYDTWFKENEADFRDQWWEQHVDKKGRVDDDDLKGVSAEKVYDAYQAAYRVAAVKALEGFIVARFDFLEDDGEFEDDDGDLDEGEEDDEEDDEEEDDES